MTAPGSTAAGPVSPDQPAGPAHDRASRALSRRPAGRTVSVAVALVLAWAAVPLLTGDFELGVLNFAAIFAIGAIGLNVVTGYTGQISLGHAFFMGLGAYTLGVVGARWELPMIVWLPAAVLIGGAAGAVVGPFTLRLRGNYLLVVSLALVFIGEHIWNNARWLTGGAAGLGGLPPASLPGLEFQRLQVGGVTFTKEQGYFWFLWLLVAAAVLLASNLVRSRTGRAFQAIRDQEMAAEVMGVHIASYKVLAFAIAGAAGGGSGALYGSYVGYVTPEQWNLLLSIQVIAIVIIGGSGTILGPVIGAVFVTGLPRVIEEAFDRLGAVTPDGLPPDQLALLLYGAVIVVFLVYWPDGLMSALRLPRRRSGQLSDPAPPAPQGSSGRSAARPRAEAP